MIRHLFLVSFYIVLVPSLGLPAEYRLIEGPPSTYKPGELIAFDIRLPEISNLGAYNVDVVLEGDVAGAGEAYRFDLLATMFASSNYVFPSASTFFAAQNVDSSTRERLTLTDFDLAGVNVVAGQNDRVATVVVRTAVDFNGSLRLSIDAPSLILDTPNVVPTPVSNFEMIQAAVATAGFIELKAVPEPTSFGSMIIGLAVMLLSCRKCSCTVSAHQDHWGSAGGGPGGSA